MPIKRAVSISRRPQLQIIYNNLSHHNNREAMSSAENTKPKSNFRFSIRSILVITTVFAAGALSAGHLWRAANGDISEVGPFVVTTALTPMVLMVVMSWGFRIARWMGSRNAG